MQVNNSFKKTIDLLNEAKSEQNFEMVLTLSRELSNIDPKNTKWMEYEFLALSHLGLLYENLGLLRKYAWYNGLDVFAYSALYAFYKSSNDTKHTHFLALCYGLSVCPGDQSLQDALDKELKDLGYSEINVYFLTTNRIGHLSMEPDSWLRKQFLNKNKNENCFHLFVSNGDLVNSTFTEILSREITILESKYWHDFHMSRPNLLCDSYYKTMPFDLCSLVRNPVLYPQRYFPLIEAYRDTKEQLTFSNSEAFEAENLLVELGIEPSAKIVCLHVRDSHYLDTISPDNDWSYHDVRDASIHSFLPAVEMLNNKGYTVIRIGVSSNQHLSYSNEKYFDLTILNKSNNMELLQLYVINICSFYFGMSTGPIGLAACFNRPILSVNVTPFSPFYSPKARFIPKFIYSKEETIINFNDILNDYLIKIDDISVLLTDIGDTKELIKAGIHFKENDSADILSAAIEFEQMVADDVDFTELTIRQKQLKRNTSNKLAKQSADVVCNSFLEKYSTLFEGKIT